MGRGLQQFLSAAVTSHQSRSGEPRPVGRQPQQPPATCKSAVFTSLGHDVGERTNGYFNRGGFDVANRHRSERVHANRLVATSSFALVWIGLELLVLAAVARTAAPARMTGITGNPNAAATRVVPSSAASDEEAALSIVPSRLQEGGSSSDAGVLLKLVDLCSTYPQDCADSVILRLALRVGAPPSDARRLSRVLGFCRVRRGRCEQLAVVALSPPAPLAETAVPLLRDELSTEERKIVGYISVLSQGRSRGTDLVGGAGVSLSRRKRNVHTLYIRLFREFCRSYPWRCGPTGTASTPRLRVADA